MERLIIFTRYPEPGKAKTRLIPALGAEGAARLHQQLAEHSFTQATTLQASRSIAIEVRFVGGDLTLMQTWLGDRPSYQMQGQGDLGDRMAEAFQAAFRDGCTSVVTIGTDCPDLDAELLDTAFQKLEQFNLVLGPAMDGGYYLIGLRRFVPELFQGIAWSTATVLQQTVEIADQMRLTVAELSTLCDIDRPEDLQIWERRTGMSQ